MSQVAALSRYRKFLVAAGGAVGQAVLVLQQLVGSGLLHGRALSTVQLLLAALTAIGVVVASNEDKTDRQVPPAEVDGADAAGEPTDADLDIQAEHLISGGTSVAIEGDSVGALDDEIGARPSPYPHGKPASGE